MVEPKLSVGAIFEDGGLYYEVQSVLSDGSYISKRVEKPQAVETATVQERLQREQGKSEGSKKLPFSF